VQRSKTEIYTPQNLKDARDIAAESFVLLKNQNNVLPLKKSGTIALVGPLADARENMPGTWSVATDFTKPITVLEGFKNAVGNNARILYAKGSKLDADSAFVERATMFGKTIKSDTSSAETLRQQALDIAAQADVIVAAIGEAAEMSGESSSRSNIDIPQTQKDLLAALLKTGKPVVLVLFTGRPLTIKWESENVPAILNVWFGGSEAGNAISDVLFGDVNPSGKLTTTFPQNVGQIPIYYSHMNTGRPLEQGKWFQKFRSNYLDVSNEPVYPFGYGLSYTSFSYGNIMLSKDQMHPTDKITASVTVTNTGTKEGKEVVQLYIRDLVGSVSRPVKELKGFQKISLKPGESRKVTFTIGVNDLKFYNSDLKWVSEPGDFKVFIGTNSSDVKEASFALLAK
jgi:beta-glucosidase